MSHKIPARANGPPHDLHFFRHLVPAGRPTIAPRFIVGLASQKILQVPPGRPNPSNFADLPAGGRSLLFPTPRAQSPEIVIFPFRNLSAPSSTPGAFPQCPNNPNFGNKINVIIIGPTPSEQFKAMKKAVQNGRRLRKTVRAMEVLSRQILFATTPDTRQYKPFTIKDLRLI